MGIVFSFSFSLIKLWSYIIFWENPKTWKTGEKTLDKTPNTQKWKYIKVKVKKKKIVTVSFIKRSVTWKPKMNKEKKKAKKKNDQPKEKMMNPK